MRQRKPKKGDIDTMNKPQTALVGCLEPIDKDGPRQADRIRQGQSAGDQDAQVQDGRRGPVPSRQLHPLAAALHRRRAAGAARRRHRAQSVGGIARGARIVPGRRHPRQCHPPRHHDPEAGTGAGGRSQHHRRLGHGRRQREAGRLHRCARQGPSGGRCAAGGDRRADHARHAMVAGGQHVHAARSISTSAAPDAPLRAACAAARAASIPREVAMSPSLALRPSPADADDRWPARSARRCARLARTRACAARPGHRP